MLIRSVFFSRGIKNKQQPKTAGGISLSSKTDFIKFRNIVKLLGIAKFLDIVMFWAFL